MLNLKDVKKYYKYLKETGIGYGSIVQEKETKTTYEITLCVLDNNSIHFYLNNMSLNQAFHFVYIEDLMQNYEKVGQLKPSDSQISLQKEFMCQIKELTKLKVGKCYIFNQKQVIVITRITEDGIDAVVIDSTDSTLASFDEIIGSLFYPSVVFVKKFLPCKKRFTKEEVEVSLLKLKMLSLL